MDDLSTPPVDGLIRSEEVRERAAVPAASRAAKRRRRMERDLAPDEENDLAADEQDDGQEHDVDVSA